MTLELGKSYWLIGYGKVWITNLMTYNDGTQFMARCENINKRDVGCHFIDKFEKIK